MTKYYTYTIHFVDGCYYHGYHKAGDLDPLVDGYYGSPVTNKEKWLTTMYWKVVTGVYDTFEEAALAEEDAIRPCLTKDADCLNANCGGAIPPEFAAVGGKTAGRQAVISGQLAIARQRIDPEKRRKTCRETALRLHSEGRGLGSIPYEVRSERSKIVVQKTNSSKWVDPDHPELGTHNPGNLVHIQRSRGLPHGKENRRKLG